MADGGSPGSPIRDTNPHTRPLRRGDLCRVSEVGAKAEKRLKDRDNALGRITAIAPDGQFTVEWIIMGGSTPRVPREHLVHTTAQQEGMTEDSNRRRRRPPPELLVNEPPKAKREKKEENATKNDKKADAKKTAPGKKKSNAAATKKSADAKPKKKAEKKTNGAAVKKEKPSAAAAQKDKSTTAASATKKVPVSSKADNPKKAGGGPGKKRPLAQTKPETSSAPSVPPTEADGSNKQSGLSLYEKQRREFERIIARLEKVDKFGWFWDDAPDEFDEKYEENESSEVKFPSHAPFNWEMIKRRREQGRYVLNREKKEEDERFKLLEPYYAWRNKRPKRRFQDESPATAAKKLKRRKPNRRVINPQGVHWDLFAKDALAMIDAAVERNADDEKNSDVEDRQGVEWAARKVREAILGVVEKTGRRHEREMQDSDDRHKFSLVVEKATNNEAAMQSWRKSAFPERRYERLSKDRVCAGLSQVDEHIASHELKTSLDNSFIGVSYRFDDTGQSEAWMKSVIDETEVKTESNGNGKKKTLSKKATKERQAALAMAGDEGVRRAQVTATMNALIMGVEDRVMTENGVLVQPELRSANWLSSGVTNDRLGDTRKEAANGMLEKSEGVDSNENVHTTKTIVQAEDSTNPITKEETQMASEASKIVSGSSQKDSTSVTSGVKGAPSQSRDASNLEPELVEQPVWGLDCYTRRNITICLESEVDAETARTFTEKWLLPAINACPEELAQDVKNASLLLEGLSFEHNGDSDEENGSEEDSRKPKSQMTEWSHTLLGNALVKKINTAAPPYITACANILRRARMALGLDFFRVHPKGHGSVLLSEKVKPNTLVTFYRGEIYPPWRWCEKMDAIDITQRRKSLKPALPDFYNMTMERPQTDPRGYGNLIVDASRKAGHGSSLSHSCDPTCEVRVCALNGELCLAMTTLRELEIGEELTFNYNASTDSFQEYRSAVCLCGYGNCRGSFLHFATADCYQQVLNRNSPIASRFANLVKGCTKQVMSEEDERTIQSHGFRTAVFGAVAVNRRETRATKHGSALLDSLAFVPTWLKTYVADVLRYIEYERRALPIALICDQSNKGKEGGETKGVGDDSSQPENAFSFFVKNQADILLDLVKKETDDHSDANVAKETRRLGANLWRALSAEKKQRWQDAARADFEKRKKEGSIDAKERPVKKSKKELLTLLDENNDRDMATLISNEFEFQEADSEGMNAMSQRVQQLTAALSRVGRVLDRHRESIIAQEDKSSFDHETLRDSIPPPICVISDEEVVEWMWNSSDGVVVPLLRRVEVARCVRPSLIQGIMGIRQRYSELQQIGSVSPQSVLADGGSARQVLNEALLELRALILDELRAMAKEFRQRKKSKDAATPQEEAHKEENPDSEPPDENPDTVPPDETPDTKPTDENLDTKPTDENPETKPTDENPITKPNDENSESDKLLGNDATDNADGLTGLMDEMLCTVERRVSPEQEDSKSTSDSGKSGTQMVASDKKPKAPQRIAPSDATSQEDEPWVAHYNERFMLQASADILLMYANTSNFFSANAYAPLESSPIEIYARELGNNVPRSAIDTDVTTSGEGKQTDVPTEQQKKGSRAKKEYCLSDDVVAEVKVRYQGDYVLSQLLQWYNGGMGQQRGLPNLAGSVVLPSIDACWSSKLAEEKRKSKALTRTYYESKLRPQLVEWMQDPYKRGDPWPNDVDNAYSSTSPSVSSRLDDEGEISVRFGSPVLDFLVSGDESGIFAVLEELDADNKVSTGGDDADLLTSVDRGRPAQAVCRWVQCENPDCLKWRKMPWHVDIDLLPEKFFCKDNKWDKLRNNCEAPEDDWDKDDKIVGSDGKVEGSPIKKDQFTSPSHEWSFRVGAKFDVLRQTRGAKKFCVGTVTHVDFSGKVKRVKFHYNKTPSESDEWIPFGSKRIAPLHSKTTPISKKRKLIESGSVSQSSKGGKVTTQAKAVNEKKATKTEDKKMPIGPKVSKKGSEGNDEQTPTKGNDAPKSLNESPSMEKNDSSNGKNTSTGDKNLPEQVKMARRRKKRELFMDPSDIRSFNTGCRFDVLRSWKGADKWVVATIVELDFASEEKRVRFHYRKSTSEQDDWIPFGSPRIAALFSKTPLPKPKKRKSSSVTENAKQETIGPAQGDGESSSPPKKLKTDLKAGRSESEQEAALALLSSHAAAIIDGKRATPEHTPVHIGRNITSRAENGDLEEAKLGSDGLVTTSAPGSPEGKFGSLLRVASDIEASEEPTTGPAPARGSPALKKEQNQEEPSAASTKPLLQTPSMVQRNLDSRPAVATSNEPLTGPGKQEAYSMQLNQEEHIGVQQNPLLSFANIASSPVVQRDAEAIGNSRSLPMLRSQEEEPSTVQPYHEEVRASLEGESIQAQTIRAAIAEDDAMRVQKQQLENEALRVQAIRVALAKEEVVRAQQQQDESMRVQAIREAMLAQQQQKQDEVLRAQILRTVIENEETRTLRDRAIRDAIAIRAHQQQGDTLRAQEEAFMKLAQQQVTNQALEEAIRQEQERHTVASQALEQASIRAHGQDTMSSEATVDEATMRVQQALANQAAAKRSQQNTVSSLSSNADTNDALGCLMMLASASSQAPETNDSDSQHRNPLLPTGLGYAQAAQSQLSAANGSYLGQQIALANSPLRGASLGNPAAVSQNGGGLGLLSDQVLQRITSGGNNGGYGSEVARVLSLSRQQDPSHGHRNF